MSSINQRIFADIDEVVRTERFTGADIRVTINSAQWQSFVDEVGLDTKYADTFAVLGNGFEVQYQRGDIETDYEIAYPSEPKLHRLRDLMPDWDVEVFRDTVRFRSDVAEMELHIGTLHLSTPEKIAHHIQSFKTGMTNE